MHAFAHTKCLSCTSLNLCCPVILSPFSSLCPSLPLRILYPSLPLSETWATTRSSRGCLTVSSRHITSNPCKRLTRVHHDSYAIALLHLDIQHAFLHFSCHPTRHTFLLVLKCLCHFEERPLEHMRAHNHCLSLGIRALSIDLLLRMAPIESVSTPAALNPPKAETISICVVRRYDAYLHIAYRSPAKPFSDLCLHTQSSGVQPILSAQGVQSLHRLIQSHFLVSWFTTLL